MRFASEYQYATPAAPQPPPSPTDPEPANRTAGLYAAAVIRAERITPHMMRVTFGGEDLTRLPVRGYDQWFRLFLPRSEGDTDFGSVPEQFGMTGCMASR